MTRDDFHWEELPLDVLIRFDVLPASAQALFAVDLKPDEDRRTYCKERVRRLKSAGWPIEDMVDLARASPHGFGKFYINTWPVFAAILEELGEERRARRSKIKSGDRQNQPQNVKRRGANKCELTRAIPQGAR
jgi:hypothetical protein